MMTLGLECGLRDDMLGSRGSDPHDGGGDFPVVFEV